jgi:4-carboxymuconolactone decarboxylase
VGWEHRPSPVANESYRLEPLRDRAALDEAQEAMWASIAGGVRAPTAVRTEGQLNGPFDVLLRTPEVGTAVGELGELLRFSTTLGPRLTEVVILTIVGHWHARLAWSAHAAYAEREGIPRAKVDAIARGEDPSLEDPAERAVWAVAHGLVTTGRVPDDTYATALAVLGERTLVEVVALSGYYCLSSLVLNAFRVPLPEGVVSPWDGQSLAR